MIEVHLPESEVYDEVAGVFMQLPEINLRFEHNLVSVSKWEATWHKPFIDSKDKTFEETLSYLAAMDLDGEKELSVYSRLSPKDLNAVLEYIDAPMTATTFTEVPGSAGGPRGGSGEYVTSELIYYWMISLQIPMECQYWHLKRLLTLIKVVNLKNQPKKKMSRTEALNQQRALNAKRRAQMGTRG